MSNPEIVTLEEHYTDAGIEEAVSSWRQATGRTREGIMRDRLLDLGPLRIGEMDKYGVDLQVVSHSPHSLQMVNSEVAPERIARANEGLAKAIGASGGRLAGFAALPVSDPEACADELERAVRDFGLRGAMVPPHSNGVFLDNKRFWPMFQRAAALDVPIYIHPAASRPGFVESYYADFEGESDSLREGGGSTHIDPSIVSIRLLKSGVFEAYPDLKIVLGHMGESLPFILWRVDHSMHIRKNFCEHFYITTSGNFSTPALLCSILELGIDRVMFSVDYPYAKHEEAMAWLPNIPLSGEDMAKFLGGNARRLLKL